MPRRRRLFTPNKHKIKSVTKVRTRNESDSRDDVNTARGRFKGALKDILEPAGHDDSDDSTEESPVKRDRRLSEDKKYLSDEEAKKALRRSPPRQSYVLKLFDRSVDLSQFRDDSPLYPICRAWMANQPKANYSDTSRSEPREAGWEGGAELPGPEGPPVGKLPARLPPPADKNNIDLNYRGAGAGAAQAQALPSREQLLRLHMPRWAAVKLAWQEHILLKEARYEGTQKVLNRINLEYPSR